MQNYHDELHQIVLERKMLHIYFSLVFTILLIDAHKIVEGIKAMKTINKHS